MKRNPLVIVIAAVVVIPLIALLAANANSNNTVSASATPSPVVSNSPATVPTPNSNPHPSMPSDAVTAHQVVLKTSMGDITLNLFPDDAPLAVENFVTLGSRGYYTNVIFHRVIKDFMIQGGDPTGTGTGGESIYGKFFKTELPAKQFTAGTLGAARTSALDTNGSQFFITSVDYHSLDGQYTVFGQAADDASLNVVKAIDAVATDPSTDKPLQDVKITGFAITKK